MTESKTPDPNRRPVPARRRRLVIGAVAVVAVAAVSVAVAARGDRFKPEPELKAAEESLRRNEPAVARAHVDRVLAVSPNDARALFLAAQAARRADACAEAENFLSTLEGSAGATPATQLEWTLLGVQQGDFGEDEARLQKDVERNHAFAPEILEAVAKGFDRSIRWPEAVFVLDRLIDRYPNHVPALLLRGKIQDRLRQSDAAEADFRAAVGQAPESADAHSALAGLLDRRGHTREAIYHFEMALRFRPGEATTMVGLARALANAGDLNGVERTLDELIATASHHPDALVDRARVALRRGQFAVSESLLDRAVHAAPWHREAHRFRLAALKELGRTDQVAQCEVRLAELKAEDGAGGRLKLRARENPGETNVRWDLYHWAKRNGEPDEALAWLLEILRADPKDARGHTGLAEYFERTSQPRRAAAHRAAAGKEQ